MRYLFTFSRYLFLLVFCIDVRGEESVGVDFNAQYQKGMKYMYGDGVERDPVKAVKLFKIAAANGNANAQVGLANAYFRGDGVAQSYKEAAKWFRKGADKGDKESQTQLAFLYAKGLGLNKSEGQAVY